MSTWSYDGRLLKKMSGNSYYISQPVSNHIGNTFITSLARTFENLAEQVSTVIKIISLTQQ